MSPRIVLVMLVMLAALFVPHVGVLLAAVTLFVAVMFAFLMAIVAVGMLIESNRWDFWRP